MLGFYGVKLNSTRLTLELDGRGLELGRFDGVGAFHMPSSSKASRVPEARVGAKGRVWDGVGLLAGGLDLGEAREFDFRKLAVTTMTAARPFRRKASRMADMTACHEKKPSISPRDGASLTSPPPKPCFDTAWSSQKAPKRRAAAAQARAIDAVSPFVAATALTAAEAQTKKTRLSLLGIIWLRMSVITAPHRKTAAVATISKVASGTSAALSIPKRIKAQM